MVACHANTTLTKSSIYGTIFSHWITVRIVSEKTDVAKCLNDCTLEDVFKQIEEKCNLSNGKKITYPILLVS